MKNSYKIILRDCTIVVMVTFFYTLNAQVPSGIGTGSITNGNTEYPAPYGNNMYGARHQILVRASEMTDAGMSAGNLMSLGFFISSPVYNIINEFSIGIKHTSDTSLTQWHSGFTQVYAASAYMDAAGWNMHPFSTFFNWDGISNLIIETCFNNSAYFDHPAFYQSSTSYVSCLVYAEDVNTICSAVSPGYTDYMQRPNLRFISQGNFTNDLGLLSWDHPKVACGLGSSENVSVSIKNYGSASQGNFQVAYSINNGSTYTVESISQSILPGDTLEYTFAQTANFSSLTTYNCKAYLSKTGDQFAGDDTLAGVVINNYPLISSFPYEEDFEAGNASWQPGGINSSWQLGTPSGSNITFAASGIKSWVTNLAGTYNANEKSWVESPCFNFTGLVNPNISFIFHCSTAGPEDGAALQYSVDGINWQHLGSASSPPSPAHWYESSGIQGLQFSGSIQGWSDQTDEWDTAIFAAPYLGGEPVVKFRFIFGSNNWDEWNDGFAFDKFRVFQPAAMVYDSCTASQDDTTYTAQGKVNQEILHISVMVSNPTYPLGVTAFNLTTTGSTNATDISAARLWYTGNQPVFSDTGLFGQVLSPSASYSITGNLTLSEGLNHFWLTYDIAPTATAGNAVDAVCSSVVVDDTARIPSNGNPPGNRKILQAMAGTYTISKTMTADYTSFSAAVADLELRGVGAVVFEVDTGTYNEQLWLHQIPGTSAGREVTFRSANGDSAAVVLLYAAASDNTNFVVRFDHCKHIVLSRISIKAGGTAYARVIEFLDQNDSIRIDNCLLEGAEVTAAEYSFAQALVLAQTAYSNHNLILSSCTMLRGSYGVAIMAADLSGGSGLRILNNAISGQYQNAIYLNYQEDFVISGNLIQAFNMYWIYSGISNMFCGGPALIDRNRLILESPGALRGLHSYQCNLTGTDMVVISNNFISLASNAGSRGIYCEYSGNYDFYHNSVFVYGNDENSSCFHLDEGSQSVNSGNNIFCNLSGGYAMRFNVDTSRYSSDYNVLYSNGPSLVFRAIDYPDLPSWQSGYGRDLHSLFVNPGFSGTSDPHLYTAEIDNKGMPLPLVTQDIDAEPRSPLHPDPGCDEFTAPAIELTLSELVSPASGCGIGVEPVIIRVKNIGTITVTGTLLAGYKQDIGSTYTTQSFPFSIPSLGHADLTFTGSLDLSGYNTDTSFGIDAFIQFTGDIHPANDTLHQTVAAGFLPPMPVTSDTTIAGGNSATVKVSSNHLIYWFGSDTASVALGAGKTYKTPLLYDSTTYYAAASGASKYKLTTTYSATSSIGGMMVDIQNNDFVDVVIDSLDINVSGTSNYTLEVYYKNGSYSGFHNQPSAWTLLGSQLVIGKGSGNPTHVNIGGLIVPAQTTYSIYIHCNSYIQLYKSGITVYYDDHLMIPRAASLTSKFGNVTPGRIWNGSIYYSISNNCLTQRVPANVNVTGTPGIQLSDTCLDFDTVMFAGSASDTLTITNTGNYALKINSIQATGNGFLAGQSSMVVLPGNPGKLAVSFSPPGVGSFSGDLLLQTNLGNYHICLKGAGTSAVEAQISPAAFNLNFTNCADSSSKQIVIRNTGSGILNYEFIGNYGFSYDSTSEKYYTSSGQTLTHNFINLNPNADSLFLVITLNGDYDNAGESVSMSIDGTFIVEINPYAIYSTHTFAFGGAQVKTWLADRQLTVVMVNSNEVNPGTGTGMNRIRLTMPGITWIYPSPDTGQVIAGDSAIVGIMFRTAGVNAGVYNTDLQIKTNDPLHQQVLIPCTLTLSGTPQATLQNNQVVFDSTMIGQSSINSVTIGNDGCDTLFITGIQHSLSIFIPDNTQFAIPPDETSYLYITFAPVQPGNFRDTFHIITNDAPLDIFLQGIGNALPGIGVTPASFNETINCQESISRNLSISNSGAFPLTVSISLSAGSGWIVLGDTSETINPGGNASIPVTFRRNALAPGVYTRNIIISSNDPGNPQIIVPCSLHLIHPYKVVDLPEMSNICQGGNVLIDAGAGFSSYLWNTGSTSQAITVTAGGKYSVIVSSNEGCISSDSTQAMIRNRPNVGAGIDKGICEGYSTTLNGSVTGGTPPLIVTWLPDTDLDDNQLLVPVANPLNTTTYVLSVVDAYLCSDTDTMSVIVNPTPQIAISNDSILEGDSALLFPTISGGVLPYLYYSWSPTAGLETPSAFSTWAKPAYTTIYTLSVTGSNGCIGTGSATVKVTRISLIDGIVSYYNSINTPLPNTKVLLYRYPSELVDSCFTNGSGYYYFDTVFDGVYFINCYPPQPWGGVNATDALEIQKHVVGMTTLSGLMSKAADLNCSSFISSADALMVMRRFVKLMDTFCGGSLNDYQFENYLITIDGEDRLWNIRGLCAGDVNRSHIPGLKNYRQAVFNESDEIIQASQGSSIHLPVRIPDGIDAGAISLELDIPKGLKLLGVNTTLGNALYSADEGMLRFAWQDVAGEKFLPGDQILELTLAIAGGEAGEVLRIQPTPACEFADRASVAYGQVNISIPAVKIQAEGTGSVELYQNYPNPASGLTTIGFFLPEISQVDMELCNVLGEKTSMIISQEFPPGNQEVTLDTRNIPPGVYVIYFRASGPAGHFLKAMKMTVSR